MTKLNEPMKRSANKSGEAGGKVVTRHWFRIVGLVVVCAVVGVGAWQLVVLRSQSSDLQKQVSTLQRRAGTLSAEVIGLNTVFDQQSTELHTLETKTGGAATASSLPIDLGLQADVSNLQSMVSCLTAALREARIDSSGNLDVPLC